MTAHYTHSISHAGKVFTMRGRAGDHIGRSHAAGVFYEIPLLQTLDSLLKDRRTDEWIIDVGAHVGNHSVFFAGVCQHKVIALEPYPESYRYLQQNIIDNDLQHLITPLPLVGARGTYDMIEPPENNTGMAKCVESAYRHDIPGISVDTFADLPVALLKIDVEGMEYDVLAESEDVLRWSKPIVVVESVNDNKDAVFGLLKALGYEHQGTYCATPTHVFVYEGLK